ncbi:ERF family ssDNA binding protein [Streptomyces phage HFrancette]|uniref:ERF family ssDNA binding protein n=1 Tax=Streptomyces phage HFrancette TaxID=2926108 RepID=A0A9E7NHZ9_9CAUD|nr:ERF family ssDNA binding protein [Streptomyces phage HFrancette]UTN92131.1 ERF family ssDNA binding protein [Streptomyces phage HFrancette]
MTVTALPLPSTAPQPSAPPIYQPAPTGAPADAPRVFTAIAAVMRDAMPVGKNQRNEQQNYKFRGIDDVMSAMAGPMRKHGVFILPTIADHTQQRDGKMTRTVITMRYSVYGPAGDCLVAEVPGEAFDFADKATNKAQSAALKYLLFTLFMLPVDGRSIDDGDRDHSEPSPEHRAEMQQRRQRGQRQQQPRRSSRAEPGPWEQPQQEQRQQRPDYLAAAQAAGSREEFDKIRAAAAEAGAPADYLARLDAVLAQKQKAAQQEKQQGDRPAPPSAPAKTPEAAAEAAYDGPRSGRTPEAAAPDSAALAAEAEQALRLAASRANLPTLDADFERVYGLPIEQAGAAQLDQFRRKIEAAGGAK